MGRRERGKGEKKGGEPLGPSRAKLGTDTISLLLHFFHQSKAQGQARFKGRESRLYLLMVGEAKKL